MKSKAERKEKEKRAAREAQEMRKEEETILDYNGKGKEREVKFVSDVMIENEEIVGGVEVEKKDEVVAAVAPKLRGRFSWSWKKK